MAGFILGVFWPADPRELLRDARNESPSQLSRLNGQRQRVLTLNPTPAHRKGGSPNSSPWGHHSPGWHRRDIPVYLCTNQPQLRPEAAQSALAISQIQENLQERKQSLNRRMYPPGSAEAWEGPGVLNGAQNPTRAQKNVWMWHSGTWLVVALAVLRNGWI